MMPSVSELLERESTTIDLEPGSFDRLLRRRDRKRRNQRIAAGVVGIAVFVAAIWIVTSVGSLDRSQTSVGPAGDVTGPVETGPTETGDKGENRESHFGPKQALIGTVTQSRAGCALEIVAEPTPSGPGRLRVVNEMNRWVSFEMVRLDSVGFTRLEAIVANGNYAPYKAAHLGAAPSLGQQELSPGASGTFTTYFTSGYAFAVVCLDRHPFPGGFLQPPPGGRYALVGPIVVE